MLDDAIMVVEGNSASWHIYHGDDPFFDFFEKEKKEKGFFLPGENRRKETLHHREESYFT